MPKPKIPNSRKAAIEHRKRIERYTALINQLYDKLNKEAAKAAIGVNPDVEKPFSWSDYPETRKALKELQDQYVSEMTGIVMAGTSAEWKESDLVQDLVAQKLLKAYTGTTKAGEEYARYFQTDPDALKAFQQRKAGGMNLSQRVWNLSEQYKTELEESISAAIEPGTSAIELAAEIKKYLNEPDKRFRRVRDKFGELQLSANAKAYHPGQGVYRSSARNAQRLARTEINMAYRAAEQERWKSFDFVVGYEVKITQNGKHVEDICDCLKGKYRKDFKFMGWHPSCYKDDMDVLTKAGWKRFKDVTDDDLIMSLNPDTRAKEWVAIVATQCYDFNGKMVRFYSKALDCVVTPDHRMVYISAQTGRISHLTAIRYDCSFGGFIDGERRFKKELIPYSGKVYDLTLDRNHIMYVRRNGKCFWGSNCMCYTVPILKTEDEFFDDEDAKSVNEVEDVPQGFKDWVKDNEERIEKAEKRGTAPYFIADNRGTVDEILNNKEADKRKRTPQEIATERHAARTPEEVAKIQSAWRGRVIKQLSLEAYRYETDSPLMEGYIKSMRDARINGNLSDFEGDYNNARRLLNEWKSKYTSNLTYSPEQLARFKELSEALSIKQGRPMTLREADRQSANPNYKYNSPFDVNCQTCAPAYVLRSQGFNVMATGKTPGSVNEWIARGHSFDIWENTDGTKAKPTLYRDYLEEHGYKNMTPKRYKAFYEQATKEPGIYITTIAWKGGEGAHATIIQRFADGSLAYIEPQHYSSATGMKRDIMELCNDGAAKIGRLSQRGIMRVDNKLLKRKCVADDKEYDIWSIFATK